MSKSRFSSHNRDILMQGIKDYIDQVTPATRSMMINISKRFVKYVDENEFDWDDKTGQMRSGTGVVIHENGRLTDWRVSRNMRWWDNKDSEVSASMGKNFPLHIKTKTKDVDVQYAVTERVYNWGKKKVVNEHGRYVTKTVRIPVYKEVWVQEGNRRDLEKVPVTKTVTKTKKEKQPAYFINGYELFREAMNTVKPAINEGFVMTVISAVPYAPIVDAGGASGQNKGAGWFEELQDEFNRIFDDEFQKYLKRFNARLK